MNNNNTFSWEAPPLAPEDERLVEAYVNVGRAIDDLPYTNEFEQLVMSLSLEDNDVNRHAVFKRLLTLRKNGRLPRIASLAV